MLDCSATDNSYGVPAGTAYVRFSAYEVSDDSIITVDEEITYRQETISRVIIKPSVEIP